MKFWYLRWHWFRKEIKKYSATLWLASLIAGILAFVLLVLAGHYAHAHGQTLPQQPDVLYSALPRIDLRFLSRVGLWTSLILFAVGFANWPSPYLILMGAFWLLNRDLAMCFTVLGAPRDAILDYQTTMHATSFWQFVSNGLNSRYVFFFSGHTGLPLLISLLFLDRNESWHFPRPLSLRNCTAYFWRRAGEFTVECWTLVFPLAFITLVYALGAYSYPWPVWGCVLLLWLLILAYRRKRVSFAKLCLLWSAVMAWTVLLTHQHYTLDVYGAYMITPTIFLIGKYFFFGGITNVCDIADSR